MITVKVSVEGIKRLKKSLIAKQISKQELAKKTRIARSTVTNFFLGRPVQKEKAELICQILGTNIEEIIIEPDLHKERIENITSIEVEKIVQQIQSKLISGNETHRLNVVRVLEMHKPILLDDIYVEVKVWDDFGQYQIGDQDKSNNSEFLSTTIKGLDAIKKYSRLMLLGQPGAGKTTFLRHIATLQNFNIDENGKKISIIPILVVLRDYAYRSKKRNSLNLFDYIQNELAKYDISIQEFNTILQEGRAMFLLDGLDEVTDQENLDVCGEIIELLDEYPQNRFVISCRNAAEPFKFESFTEVQMSDFDDNQVRQFIENWFNVYLELYESNQQQIREAKEKLIRQLDAQSVSQNRIITDYLRPIKDFTQTPLLLTMLCLVVTVKGEIPSGRLELYKKSVDIFLSEWDTERGIKRKNLAEFNRKQILTLLSDIALKTQQKQETIFSQYEIEESIKKQNDLVEPLAVISFIQSHYGILVNSGFDHYSFFHKTFQEYFAALGIIELDKPLNHIDDNYIGDAFWREVLILVFEFLLIDNIDNGEDLSNEFISKILKYISSILKNNSELNDFIEQVYKIVNNKSEIKDEKTKTSLRVFLSDPDYSFDSSRTLLMELDKSIGNKLVASSFISRLFCDENDNSIAYLQLFLTGFKIASNIPDIDNADNADHALQLTYEYVKSQNYVIKYENYTLKTRKKEIQYKLESIYGNSNSDVGRQAKKCRELCLKHLKLLDQNLGLNISNFLKDNNDDPSYKYLYNATLLLIKFLKILDQSSFFQIQQRYKNAKNYIITPSIELEKLLLTIEKMSN